MFSINATVLQAARRCGHCHCFPLPRCRHHDSTPRLLQAQPPDAEERRGRGIDPVVGKAIVEKSGFFAAAVVLAVLLEKFT